jgi:uncharacterized protein (DUF2141 family)
MRKGTASAVALLALVGAALGAPGQAPAPPQDFTVRFEKLQRREGLVAIRIYAEKDPFPRRAFLSVLLAPDHFARGEPVTLTVKLAPGRYGVAVYHDLNANGKLDTNVLGIPREPYGYSGGARGPLDARKFDELAVEVTDQPLTCVVPLK